MAKATKKQVLGRGLTSILKDSKNKAMKALNQLDLWEKVLHGLSIIPSYTTYFHYT